MTYVLFFRSDSFFIIIPIPIVPICPLPPIPSNAFVSNPRTQYVEGDRVFYDCTPGYQRLAGLVLNRCLRGTWAKVTFTCTGSVHKCVHLRVPGILCPSQLRGPSRRPRSDFNVASNPI